jgi:hypothetical protein
VAATATVRRQIPTGVVEKRLRPASGGIHGSLYLPKRTEGSVPRCWSSAAPPGP